MRRTKSVVQTLILILIAFELSAAPNKQKIILDCDLGGDIDDAFAMALVLTSPEFEVLGITLDHGLTEKRAQVACRLLYQTGMEQIPVAVGRQTPNVVGKDKELGPNSPQFHWADGFSKLKPIKTSARDFIIETLRKYPHEVILFGVAPVPNLADVIEKDPEALKLAKHIYSMFGSFFMGYNGGPVPSAEWNVAADIASAKKFASSGASITYAGLDITTFLTLEEKLRLKLLMRQSPLTNALCGLYTLWGSETPVLYDAVAVGMALWPDFFKTRPAHVRVTDGGFTVVDESQPPNCEIGVSIDKEEFLKRLMRRLLEQNLGRAE
jgi:inosine-uridine nucleoside N-ribohydrolase